jgi:hypothetical protein
MSLGYNNYNGEVYKIKITPSHATGDYDEHDEPKYSDGEPFITGVNIFNIGPVVKKWAIYYRDTRDTPTSREIKDPKKFIEFLNEIVDSANSQVHQVIKNKAIFCYFAHPDYEEESDSIHLKAEVIEINHGYKISKEDSEALMQL